MSWGYKILLLYSVFVIGIVYMVFKSSAQNVDLVTPDYYEQELKYQSTIDATNLANALSEKLKCTADEQALTIVFPKEMQDVQKHTSVWLYCIANKKKDIRQEVTTADATVTVPLRPDNKGMYDVKVTWKANGKDYYFEEKLFLQ